MITKITSKSCMSNAGLHRSGGLGSPASRWSLRNAATGEYVNLYAITKSNDAIRGDAMLDIEADLPEGTYVLATGKGDDRIEQIVTVGASPYDAEATLKAALKSLPRLKAASSKQESYADSIRRGWAKDYAIRNKADELAALAKVTSARAILDNKDRDASDALYDQERE